MTLIKTIWQASASLEAKREYFLRLASDASAYGDLALSIDAWNQWHKSKRYIVDTGAEGIGSSRGIVREYNPSIGTWTPVNH